jgi:hypothetical protein
MCACPQSHVQFNFQFCPPRQNTTFWRSLCHRGCFPPCLKVRQWPPAPHSLRPSKLCQSPGLQSIPCTPPCPFPLTLYLGHLVQIAFSTTCPCAYRCQDSQSSLNRLVDHIASSSQYLPLPPLHVPTPSFFMDNFMLFSSSQGFVEWSSSSFVGTLLARTQVVMCRLGLEALSQPKPALESRAEPKLWWRLMGAHGSGFTFSKPEPGA